MLKALKKKQKGQSSLEYVALIVIVMAAIITSQNYFKRSLQGRWKSALDDLGDQYDPRAADSYVIQKLFTSHNTDIHAIPANNLDGYWTQRVDQATTAESKTGREVIGAY